MTAPGRPPTDPRDRPHKKTGNPVEKVKAKKALGQHFLTDRSIARRIADTVDGAPNGNVLEVGPGMGILTECLLEKGCNVLAAEIDSESVEYLLGHFPALEGRIVQRDFLKMDLSGLFAGENFTLIGNFPYNISSQIMFRALEYTDRIHRIGGMFQREVAQRLTAPPGSKVYGILSVLLDVYYRPEYLFTVPETVFSPPPKVKSGVIRLERREDIPQDFKAEALLRVVKAAFNQRRKTLRNALRPLGIPSGLADHPLLDRRAEQLSSAEFLDLSRWEWGN